MAYKMLGDKPFSTQYITGNKYYSLGEIPCTHIILHSVGVGSSRTTQQWRDSWNKSTKNSVSAVAGPDEGIIMLPTFEKVGKTKKCAGCGVGSSGKSYNRFSAQCEMQEHKSIKYVGGATFKTSDPKAATEYQLKTLDTAIQWMANVCIFHNLNPLEPGIILSHRECSQKPYLQASSHGDVEHLFEQLPDMHMSMDKVRQLVAERVEQYKLEEEFNNMTQADFDKYLTNASPEVIDKLVNAYLNRRSAIKDPSSWAKKDIDWISKEAGIMNGGDNGNMMPMGLLTRQELAALLHRYYEKFDK